MKKMQQKNKRIQIYKIEYNSLSKQAMRMANTKFQTQEGSNHNTRFLNGKKSYSP
jgi:hypothetical protein